MRNREWEVEEERLILVRIDEVQSLYCHKILGVVLPSESLIGGRVIGVPLQPLMWRKILVTQCVPDLIPPQVRRVVVMRLLLVQVAVEKIKTLLVGDA